MMMTNGSDPRSSHPASSSSVMVRSVGEMPDVRLVGAAPPAKLLRMSVPLGGTQGQEADEDGSLEPAVSGLHPVGRLHLDAVDDHLLGELAFLVGDRDAGGFEALE